MPATIAAAKAGATTGEWAETMREVFGAYRGPTGVDGATAPTNKAQLETIRRQVEETEKRIGHPIKILVGKPGLDGHSNGAEQIALRARDVGMEVIYQGIRLTPAEIATSALQEDVDVVGLSILSGSHLELIPEVVRLLNEEGLEIPVVVGGIIPVADAQRLRDGGVAGVYTPKDFDVNQIMSEIVDPGQRARRRPHHCLILTRHALCDDILSFSALMYGLFTILEAVSGLLTSWFIALSDQPEVFLSEAPRPRAPSDARRRPGELRKIGPRLYTRNIDEPPEILGASELAAHRRRLLPRRGDRRPQRLRSLPRRATDRCLSTSVRPTRAGSRSSCRG